MGCRVTKWMRRVGISSLLGLGFLVLPQGTAWAQYARPYGYDRPQRNMASPVDVTMRHIEAIANRSGGYASGRDRSRLSNALRHLSQFQDRYYRGDFDKGKLDEAIGDVQNVVDRNPLDGRARNMLWGDLNDLRAFRAARGYRGYGYQ